MDRARPAPGVTPQPVAGRGERFPGLRPALLTGAAASAGVLTVHLYDPRTPGSYGVCPLRATTGFLCPWCGATRAVHALTQGQWDAALGFNPLVPVLLPVLLAAWSVWVLRSLRGRRTRYLERLPVFFGILGASLGFGVLRNLPSLQDHLARLT